jgi:SAM-dependent methyltransferase
MRYGTVSKITGTQSYGMFFPHLIKSIKPSDRVLEIGPGGSPHPRSDIFLEYQFDSPSVAESQRGYEKPLITDKPVIFYTGSKFPFGDKDFDYVICSHVVEHVPDVNVFISEICRVGKAGYLEYPTIYYDYIYNFPEHTTFVKYKASTLFWMPKTQTSLAEFQPVQDFFYQSLSQRYFDLVNDLKPFFFEGFEWFNSVQTCRSSELRDVIFDNLEIPLKKPSIESRLRNFSFSRSFGKIKRILFNP